MPSGRANRALGIALHVDAAPLHGAHVEPQQAPRQALAHAGKQLERFGRLHAADDADHRGEHAHGGAIGLFDVVGLGEQAVITRRLGVAQVVDADLPVEEDGRARHQRLAMLHAGAVDGVAGSEVVGAVQHQVGLRHGVRQGLALQPLDAGMHAGLRIEGGQHIAAGLGLGPADARGGVEDLALQVAELDDVVIGQRDVADAGGGQVERGGRTQSTRPYDKHTRRQQSFLPFDTQLVEQDVAGVAQ
ncbi:hypothetical protein BBAD15_g12492 [Beauveria bassiana D1-5]|uniref:Uncharacterized protein n=1 Tax=Beauveria bassiana D1-5 TaxID=1245745 RepID=A0A0A2V496_BEABA|nr:hypothetical protein BBAD15_g12492 [Beauveria bassiana D1-5]